MKCCWLAQPISWIVIEWLLVQPISRIVIQWLLAQPISRIVIEWLLAQPISRIVIEWLLVQPISWIVSEWLLVQPISWIVIEWFSVGAECRYDDELKPATLSQSSLKLAALKSTPAVATDEFCSSDMLSNSSLRRKLFFHGDEGTPISPVRCDQPRLFYLLTRVWWFFRCSELRDEEQKI